MSNEKLPDLGDLSVDTSNLYREETITDLKVATIRRLVPITTDGQVDTSRSEAFIAMTQVVTPQGAIPVQAQIQAASIKEAIERFPEAVQAGLERMMDEVREMQREEASRIVIPDRDQANKLFNP